MSPPSQQQPEGDPGHPPPRRISRLLVANRGEIAARIVSAARELGIEAVTLYTDADDSHTLLNSSSHSSPDSSSNRNGGDKPPLPRHGRVRLPSPASYMDVGQLVRLARAHGADAVHPGYGFLSESADLARRLWAEAGAAAVGPGWAALARTGDKPAARALAQACGVPVLQATDGPVDAAGARTFMMEALGGRPIVLKAVDGGGGRGIRVVRDPADLPRLARLAAAESPSGQFFAERAAVDGFRHVEVQVLGDGTGAVRHLWERECSIQRRFQKVVEMAPSTLRWPSQPSSSPDHDVAWRRRRDTLRQVIDAALRMAGHLRYLSLGTFEFLAHPQTGEFFFLEINPRLQVEHTVTEAIAGGGVDLVQAQLAIAQGARLDEVKGEDAELAAVGGLRLAPGDPDADAPSLYAVQLRLTAEDPAVGWSLSVGRISGLRLPSGSGVRVDTALVSGRPAAVSSDFDSLLAKIIVSAATWPAVVRRARRALADTHVAGVRTNLDVLRAIVASPAFEAGECDIEWLEKEMPALLESGRRIAREINSTSPLGDSPADGLEQEGGIPSQGVSSSAVVFRKGDSWKVNLTPQTTSSSGAEPVSNHLKLDRVLRNEFPYLFSAEISYATPTDPAPRSYRLDLSSTQASATSTVSKHRRGDPSNPRHVVTPFPGKLVEVMVDEGDQVAEGDVIAVVQQMKMELDIRSPRNGRVAWVTEAEDGEDVAEGMLIVELQLEADVTKGADRPKL